MMVLPGSRKYDSPHNGNDGHIVRNGHDLRLAKIGQSQLLAFAV